MSGARIIITGQRSRQKAHAWVDKAPPMTEIDFRAQKRTLPQNARMWAMLSAIADQMIWHGAKWSPDDWKDYFMHSLAGARFMPHEEGGMIPIGRRTSRLDKQDHSLLTDLIEAFAHKHGIDLTSGGGGDDN